MDTFLDTYNLQNEINNLKRARVSDEIEEIIKYLLSKDRLGPDGFVQDSTQCHRINTDSNQIVPLKEGRKAS